MSRVTVAARPHALILVAALAACGGRGVAVLERESSAPEPGSQPASPPSDEASSVRAPELPRDGGASLADAANAATRDDRIDPIEVGRAWTYAVEVLGFYPSCSNGVFTATTLGTTVVDELRAFRVQSLCERAGVYTYAVDGDAVASYFAGRWRESLAAPVAETTTWTDGFRDYTWEAKGDVTTPAGTFSACWSAKVIASFDSYTVFCRGVGPVKWHYEDGFGNGYEAILLGKNF